MVHGFLLCYVVGRLGGRCVEEMSKTILVAVSLWMMRMKKLSWLMMWHCSWMMEMMVGWRGCVQYGKDYVAQSKLRCDMLWEEV